MSRYLIIHFRFDSWRFGNYRDRGTLRLRELSNAELGRSLSLWALLFERFPTNQRDRRCCLLYGKVPSWLRSVLRFMRNDVALNNAQGSTTVCEAVCTCQNRTRSFLHTRFLSPVTMVDMILHAVKEKRTNDQDTQFLN